MASTPLPGGPRRQARAATIVRATGCSLLTVPVPGWRNGGAANPRPGSGARPVSGPRSRTLAVAVVCGPLAAAYFLSEFFRISHAVIAPDLIRELDISVEGLSVLASAFFFAFALIQIPVGVALDRFGPRRTVPGFIAIAIVGSALFATAESAVGLTVGRVFMGAGWAVAFLGALVVLARWVPGDRYATAVSLFLALGAAGNLTATAPLAAMAEAVGWRPSIGAVTIVAGLVAVLVYALVRDAPPGHDYHVRAPETLAANLRGVREAIATPQLPYLFAMNSVAYGMVITVLGLWGAPYLYDVHGLDAVARGNVLLVMTLAMAAGSLGIGPLDRLLDTRRRIVTVAATAAAGVHAILALVQGLAVWQATVLFGALGCLGALGVVNLAHARAIFPDRLVGRGMVMMALAAFGGSALMQLATGVIIGAFPTIEGRVPEGAYRAAFGFISCLLIIAVLYHRRAADARPSEDATRWA